MAAYPKIPLTSMIKSMIQPIVLSLVKKEQLNLSNCFLAGLITFYMNMCKLVK